MISLFMIFDSDAVLSLHTNDNINQFFCNMHDIVSALFRYLQIKL